MKSVRRTRTYKSQLDEATLTGENADALTFGRNDDAFTFSRFCAPGLSGLAEPFALPFAPTEPFVAGTCSVGGCAGPEDVAGVGAVARLPLNGGIA